MFLVLKYAVLLTIWFDIYVDKVRNAFNTSGILIIYYSRPEKSKYI